MEEFFQYPVVANFSSLKGKYAYPHVEINITVGDYYQRM